MSKAKEIRDQRVFRYAARILGVWERATANDVLEGNKWYEDAHAYIERLAVAAHVSVETVAGVVAALSPRTPWATNKVWAERLVKDYASGSSVPSSVGTGDNRNKAWRILWGGEAPLSVLGGQKVTAFYRNLTGDEDAVTVDVWAARAAEGDEVTTTDKSIRGTRYEDIAQAYRIVADVVGVTPRHLQATVWVAIRGKAD